MSETIKHWSKTVNKLVNNINVNANQVVNITTGVESVGHAINADIAQRAGGDPESSTIKDTYSTLYSYSYYLCLFFICSCQCAFSRD
jgi:hypothetical protein